MKNPQDILNGYLKQQSKLLDLDEDIIRDELATKFGGFSVQNLGQYNAHLRNFKIRLEDEEEQIKLEEERIRKVLDRRVEPYYCPFHPDTRVVGTLHSRDSWRCGKGGLRCYLRWKAEKIAGHVIDWHTWDRYLDTLEVKRSTIGNYREWKASEANQTGTVTT